MGRVQEEALDLRDARLQQQARGIAPAKRIRGPRIHVNDEMRAVGGEDVDRVLELVHSDRQPLRIEAGACDQRVLLEEQDGRVGADALREPLDEVVVGLLVCRRVRPVSAVAIDDSVGGQHRDRARLLARGPLQIAGHGNPDRWNVGRVVAERPEPRRTRLVRDHAQRTPASSQIGDRALVVDEEPDAQQRIAARRRHRQPERV